MYESSTETAVLRRDKRRIDRLPRVSTQHKYKLQITGCGSRISRYFLPAAEKVERAAAPETSVLGTIYERVSNYENK
jgi:hypothetical protein